MTPRIGDYGVLLQYKRRWVKDPFISLITWATKSPAYHSVLVVEGPAGLSIVEAQPGGAKINAWDEYGNVEWSNDELSDEQRKAISEAGVAFLNREYNFYDDALIGVTRVFKEAGIKWLWKKMSMGHSVECAQLVDAAYLEAGVHLFNDGRQTGQVAPSDLFDLIEEGTHKYD